MNLDQIITARSLAYWAMDDGYKSVNGFYFCTESYTLEDNHKLSLILKNQFNNTITDFLNIFLNK